MRSPTPSVARIAAALGLLVCACGGGSDGPGLIQGEPVPEAEAPMTGASTVCTAWQACGCSDFDDRFADVAACEAALVSDVEAQLAAGEAAGLTYDAQCMGDVLARYDALGCLSLSELLEDLDRVASLSLICKIHNGTDVEGAACTEPAGVSGDSCAQGLACQRGVCVSTALVPAGDPCSPGALCAGGTLCVPVDSPTAFVCAALPDIGRSCLGVLDVCSFGAACDQGTKTCAALPGGGEACAPEGGASLSGRCDSASQCEAEMCVTTPGIGEACTTACADGASCEAGVCTAAPPLVCAADLD